MKNLIIPVIIFLTTFSTHGENIPSDSLEQYSYNTISELKIHQNNISTIARSKGGLATDILNELFTVEETLINLHQFTKILFLCNDSKTQNETSKNLSKDVSEEATKGIFRNLVNLNISIDKVRKSIYYTISPILGKQGFDAKEFLERTYKDYYDSIRKED